MLDFIPAENRHFVRHWDLTIHNPTFLVLGRNMHKVQGRENVWYAGADVAGLNFHENAFTAGLVIAQQLGATYPWPTQPEPAASFLAIKNWMLYGQNMFVEALTVHRSSQLSKY